MKNTKNATVNNWAVAIEDYNLKFEYIKGVKNTLADTMSRLVRLDPDTALPPEPDNEEFGKPRGGELGEKEGVHALLPVDCKPKEEDSKESPFQSTGLPTWGLPDASVREAQSKDGLCQRLFRQADKNGEKAMHPYYLDKGMIMRYVTDNKQRFEVLVVPPKWGPTLLKLAHDDLRHNGTARTYMILRRNYYWKGMKAHVTLYIKRCSLCRKHNTTATRYVKGSFEIPKAPMDFISMDLIGEFHPPSTNRNRYALTVICMLTGWVWCIPLPDKTANAVLKAYLQNVHHVFGPSKKILSDNGTEFKNELFERVAKELGIEHKVYSPPYHPQSNGRIEGFHLFLKACIAKHINLGNDEVILSLEALKNMYLVVTENLRRARGSDKIRGPIKGAITPNQLVTLKIHLRKTLPPRYEGNYRVISIKGNQVELAREGTVQPTKWFHVSHIKPLLKTTEVEKLLPAYDTFGRKTKLAIHPDNVPNVRDAKK